MEWVLKSDDNSSVEKVLSLARKLGVTVIERKDNPKKNAVTPPKGVKKSPNELLEFFGQASDFPSTEEIRSKIWSSSW